MADQTQMNRGNGVPNSPPRILARNMAEVSHDILSLAELQSRLLMLDLRQGLLRLLPSAGLLLAGLLLAASGFPIALMSLAYLLIHTAEMSEPAAFLTAAALGLVVGLLAVGGGWLLLRRRLSLFERSQQELRRNLRWVKHVLQRSERSTESVS